MKITGAQSLIKSLEAQGVEVIFGLPGGAILPVYDPIIDSTIRHILVRHEQGAGHMAEGYAQATGRPGVALVTSGPGATNIVTPISNAYMDSIPLVVITGQVPTGAIGTDAFQECDITGITQGITKHNWLITDVEDIPTVIAEAFYVATTGRPGPVLVDFPKDIAQTEVEWVDPPSIDELDLPGYRPQLDGDADLIEAAAELMASAERPVLYVGGGILKARGADALRTLAEATGIPVVTTLMARGAFPDSHELCLGMPGMHGNYTAIMAMQEADLLVSLGARFDDRVTGRLDAFAPKAKIVHVDIDPAELNKVRRADVGIVGDARRVTEDLVAASAARAQTDRTQWRAQLAGWQEQFPLTFEPSEEGHALKPQAIIEALAANSPADTIVVAGVGQHQMWAAQHWNYELPYTWINSGGRARRDWRQGWRARPHGLGDRRGWLLPDDGPGARHRASRGHPGQDRHPQQLLLGHGAPVAGDVLRRAVLRGLSDPGPPQLRDAGRGDGVRRHPRRPPRGCPPGHRARQCHQ